MTSIRAEPVDAVTCVCDSGVMVAMRDGVRLATDIWRPAQDGHPAAGAFPVILERTPYGRMLPSRSEIDVADPMPKSRGAVARYFVERGYIVVYQDCRGRYGSDGEFVKYLSDGEDGFDCCAWILAQPWCNGRIGTMGLSYAAHTQAGLGCAGAPGVAAMFLDSGGFSNAYQGGIRQGGAFELKQVTWAHSQGLQSPAIRNDPARLAALQAIDLRQWFGAMPWTRGASPLTPAPEYEAYTFDQWEHGTFDAFWQQIGLYAQGFYDHFPNAPTMHMSSWFDPYPRTATDNYIGLSRATDGPVRLILGPWTHGDRTLRFAGDVDFGPAAVLDGNLAEDYLALRARWFDAWLKDAENGVREEPAVRLFVMGGGSGRRNEAGRLDHGGRWREAADWPLPEARIVRFHLTEDGRLTREEPPDDAPARSFVFDPDDPVPSIGGSITSGAPLMAGGAYDQVEGPRFFGSRHPGRPLAERADVLVFQTPPLEADAEVIGPIAASLWVASDRPDTDITIKLIDVYPPSPDYPAGFAMNLTDGILRLRYRNAWEKPEPLEPGRPVCITVEAFPTANLFKTGHRIRLDVSSSNFPHFDVNPNTGEPEARATYKALARNTVFVDRQRPSYLLLPIVPPQLS